MRRLSTLGVAVAAVARANAASVEYVTDLPAFSLLAPCVSEAVSYGIHAQTFINSCADDRSGLQSCICRNTALSTEVFTSISSDVAGACGSTASADQSSAKAIWEQYCDPDKTVDFSSPTKNIVNAYITELSEMQYLAPCAFTGLSYAVMGEPVTNCPEEPSLYAPCVCSKADVVERVASVISRTVSYSCSNEEDITMAYDFFDHYCDMNQGTTTFPTPSGPPGDMTYHITALPQYEDLNSCAQSAVSAAVLLQTAWQCPKGAQALASCVCIKDKMSRRISSTLTSEVKYYCDVTATDDVSSALDVFAFYCSAARDETTAQVTESASESLPYPSAGSRTTSSTQPGETGANGDEEDGGGGGGNGDQEKGDDDGSRGGQNGGVSTTKRGIILASVISVIGGVVVIAALVWIIRRRRMHANNSKAQEELPSSPPSRNGHAELHSVSSQVDMASRKELFDSGISELPPQTRSNELPTQESARARHFAPAGLAHELDSPSGGSAADDGPWPLREGGHQISPLTPSASTKRAAAGNTGWQSGPVEVYEMDSTPREGQGRR